MTLAKPRQACRCRCCLALEPLARRSWPQALVSWTRLLRGRLVDPLVGRDILVGVLCGMAVSLFGQVGRLAGDTAAARWPAWPGLLNGGATVTGATMGNVGSSAGFCASPGPPSRRLAA